MLSLFCLWRLGGCETWSSCSRLVIMRGAGGDKQVAVDGGQGRKTGSMEMPERIVELLNCGVQLQHRGSFSCRLGLYLETQQYSWFTGCI